MQENKKTIIYVVLALSVVVVVLLIISFNLMPEIPPYSNTTNMTLAQREAIEHNLTTTPITRTVYDKGFFYITPNYTSFYDKNGTMLWNEIFNLNNVSVQSQGNFVATSQYNVHSSLVYVFDTTGLLYTVQPNKKILKHTLNKNGYLGLIFEESPGYQIQVYDNEGTKILTYTFAEKNAIPVDVSISEDNRFLAIPFFNYDGLAPESKTIFLYLDKSESLVQEDGDAIFSGVDVKNTIPFMSKFIGSDFYLVTDKKICTYRVSSNRVEEVLSMDISNYIKDIDIVNNQYIVIAFSEKASSSATIESNTVIVFDLEGNIIAQTEPIENLNFVTVSNQGFLVESNNTITHYNFKCVPVFSCSFEQTINDAYVINKNLDTIVTTSKTGIYEVVRSTNGY